VNRTRYDDVDIRTVDYLVETTDRKNANENGLGRKSQIWANGDKDGHVPRNVRLSLLLIELIHPDILFQSKTLFYGAGCFSMSPQLVHSAKPCTESPDDSSYVVKNDFGRRNCAGLQIWQRIPEEEVKDGMIDFSEYITETSGCYAIRASFDDDWAKQKSPDPNAPPQSHLVRARTLEKYNASVGDREIRTTRMRLFPLSELSLKPSIPPAKPESVPPSQPSPMETESTIDHMINPEPLLRPHRVFLLLVLVAVGLLICNLSQGGNRRSVKLAQDSQSELAEPIGDDADSRGSGNTSSFEDLKDMMDELERV